MFSFRRPGFNFPSTTTSITLILENSTTLFWPSWASDIHMVTQTGEQNIYTHKINKSKIKKENSLSSKLHCYTTYQTLQYRWDRIAQFRVGENETKVLYWFLLSPNQGFAEEVQTLQLWKEGLQLSPCMQALPSIIFPAEALLLHLLTLTFSIIMPSL